MAKSLAWRLTHRVLPNLHWLPYSEFRVCGCCGKPTVFVSFSKNAEWKLCIRCRANFRHELLAASVKKLDYRRMAILELAPQSQLRSFLIECPNYTRTYFTGLDKPGTIRDGARHEDITNLSFADESFDLIISGDVLEHVADGKAAMRETRRVLRKGGQHLFTVPTIPGNTVCRALSRDGEVVHLLEPEYHPDPEDVRGILAFWNYGMDLPQVMATEGLRIDIAVGPARDHRVVWRAVKV